MPLIILIVLLSAAVYRVTRFLINDTLISEQRRWVKLKLMGNGDVGPVRVKLLDLLSCPYCLSVWVAAAGVLASQQFQSIPSRSSRGWPSAPARSRSGGTSRTTDGHQRGRRRDGAGRDG